MNVAKLLSENPALDHDFHNREDLPEIRISAGECRIQKTKKARVCVPLPIFLLNAEENVKLLRFTLVCHGCCFRCDFVGITQIVTFDWFVVFVEFVN